MKTSGLHNCLCDKRVPRRYEDAHRKHHMVGGRGERRRSATTAENLRLSRIRRKQARA